MGGFFPSFHSHVPPLTSPSFIIHSYRSQDEYEPAGVVPGRQQAQRSAGLSATWQLAQIQLQHSDPGPAQQPHPRFWYTDLIYF